MEFIFWLSIGLIGYSYFLYPLILMMMSHLLGKVSNTSADDLVDEDLPNIAIIIAAYNEENEIISRLENLAAIDYPVDKYTIYVGSDGSTDRTNILVKNYKCQNLKFYAFENRRGKASVLNDLCSNAEEEIFIFSDANTMFDVSAVKVLVSNFNIENVGGVCGELKLSSSTNSNNQDGTYWKYEKYIKRKEGDIKGLLGANGAIYAIRSVLYQPIPSNTIVDDFMVAINVVMQGYDLAYEPAAIANECVPDDVMQEFNRRVRIGVGNYQAFFRLPQLLNPFYKSTYFFTYFSHKVLRWFTPHLMVVCLIANLFLLNNGVLYKFSFYMQVFIYFISIVAVSQSLIDKFPSIFKLLIYFVAMNAALLIGFLKYIRKNINPAWERTARE